MIRPERGQVCHSLMVESNCTPGSAQRHAAKAACGFLDSGPDPAGTLVPQRLRSDASREYGDCLRPAELLHKALVTFGFSAPQPVIHMPDPELEAMPPREAGERMEEGGRVESTRDGNQHAASRK